VAESDPPILGARRYGTRDPPMTVDGRAHAGTDGTKKIRDVQLPAADCDVLYGTAAIAQWMGMTIGQAKPLIDAAIIPTFKPPGRAARCALKTEINAAFRAYARRLAGRKALLDNGGASVTDHSTTVD
jgi:hypothetical protein